MTGSYGVDRSLLIGQKPAFSPGLLFAQQWTVTSPDKLVKTHYLFENRDQ